jgi:hypothetical protein
MTNIVALKPANADRWAKSAIMTSRLAEVTLKTPALPHCSTCRTASEGRARGYRFARSKTQLQRTAGIASATPRITRSAQ